MAMAARMVTIDCADPAALAKFWCRAAGYEVESDWGDYVVTGPAGGAAGLRLALQRVPEPRTGKNRVHIDWSAGDLTTEVDRLVGLGATAVAQHTAGDFTWQVMTDPEGNEFCVAPQVDEPVDAATSGVSGLAASGLVASGLGASDLGASDGAVAGARVSSGAVASADVR